MRYRRALFLRPPPNHLVVADCINRTATTDGTLTPFANFVRNFNAQIALKIARRSTAKRSLACYCTVPRQDLRWLAGDAVNKT